MDYVQRLRSADEVLLFPSLKKSKNTFADATGKWYARLLKRVGLKDKALVLHGLRHTGVTRLGNVGVNDKIKRVLVGHAGQDVHDRIYNHNHGVPLKMLQEGLERLEYPEVLQALRNGEKRSGLGNCSTGSFTTASQYFELVQQTSLPGSRSYPNPSCSGCLG